MSHPRLTIAIPSYNRAEMLDKQLGWAIESIAGNWDECELIISDNASPDSTPQVCAKWCTQSDGHLRVIRQPTNLGLVGNALFCIANATGDFVWVVGDDDIVLPGTFAWVLACLRDNTPARLGNILLNFRTVSGYGGAPVEAKVFDFEADQAADPGMPLFEQCVSTDENAVMLITASIYSTQMAKAAIARWPAIKDNLAFPLLLSGYTAAHGSMLVRAQPSIEYPHHTASHLRTYLNTIYGDVPRAYLCLLDESYSPSFIRPKILSRISVLVYAARFPLRFLRSLPTYLRAMRLK